MALYMEGFETWTDPVQLSLRDAMYDLVRTATEDVRLDLADLNPVDRGVGLLLLIPASVSPIRAVGEFVRALADGLAEQTAIRGVGHRIRFRMTVHQGVATRDANGWSGDAVNTVSNLVNADPVHDALTAAAEANLAVVVSDPFFQAVVRPGHRTVDPATYAPIRIGSRALMDRQAWLRVPGHPTPPGIAAPRSPQDHASSRPDHAPSRPPDHTPPRHSDLRNANGGTLVNGDYVNGDKVNGDKVYGNKYGHPR